MVKPICYLLIILSIFMLAGCRIYGTIRKNDGVLKGVTVILSNEENNITTTTDGKGNYAFKKIKPGEYKITPLLEKYIFSPASIIISKPNQFSNISGLNFKAVKKDPYYPMEEQYLHASHKNHSK